MPFLFLGSGEKTGACLIMRIRIQASCRGEREAIASGVSASAKSRAVPRLSLLICLGVSLWLPALMQRFFFSPCPPIVEE